MITGNAVAYALLIVIIIFTFLNVSSAQNQAGTQPKALKRAEGLTSSTNIITGNTVAQVLIIMIRIFTFLKVSSAQNQAGTKPKASKKAEELTGSTDMITGNTVAHALLIIIIIFTFSNISSAQNQAGTKPEASKQAENLPVIPTPPSSESPATSLEAEAISKGQLGPESGQSIAIGCKTGQRLTRYSLKLSEKRSPGRIRIRIVIRHRRHTKQS